MSVHVLFFYLTILLLPTQLGLHTWPDWTLVLGRRIDYLSPTLYLTDITLCITLLLWMVEQIRTRTHRQPHITKQIVPLIGAFLIMGINISFSSSPLISLYKWAKIIECVLFGYYIYKTKPPFRHVVIASSVAVAYSSLIGISQFLLQKAVGGIMWFLGERSFDIMTPGIARANWCWFTKINCAEVLRPYATFPHPNVFGGYIVTIMFAIALALRSEKIKRLRFWFSGVLLVSFCALCISLSRSAWSIGIVAAMIYIISTHKKNNKIIIWVYGAALLVCITIAFPYFFTLDVSNESVFVRYNLASAAIHLFTNHPLLGTGLGTFIVTLPSVAKTRDLFFIQPVHNIYLLWLVETGVVGIALIFIGLKKYIHFRTVHKIRFVYYVPVLLLLLIGLVDHYPITVQQGQLLLTLLVTLPFMKYRNT